MLSVSYLMSDYSNPRGNYIATVRHTRGKIKACYMGTQCTVIYIVMYRV